MKHLLIGLALLTAGCATPSHMTEQQALEIYNQKKEAARIDAIARCGPEPTEADSKDLQMAKMEYSVCALNPDQQVNSLPIGGPLGASTVVVDFR